MRTALFYNHTCREQKKSEAPECFAFSVGVLGLEPRMTGPESVVLPLHHTPMSAIVITLITE